METTTAEGQQDEHNMAGIRLDSKSDMVALAERVGNILTDRPQETDVAKINFLICPVIKVLSSYSSRNCWSSCSGDEKSGGEWRSGSRY